MLELKNIKKSYQTGDQTVMALDDVSLSFREKEFVSILGASGSGKTTMLNIIGGLDQYTSGDLIINGRSTKEYKDRDWDAYRNHRVGFIFQSYNLIPHQSVLSNVELALTLSGVSKTERKKRAVEVLKRVGLGDQLHKRPAQMSGGQMQRVAIARALVNDPDILLADEPTGALDTKTSVQIMDLLREISADKLIIMVTHNPDLAEQYSSRIVRLQDGHLIDDSNPYTPAAEPQAPLAGRKEKTSMSFMTALSLSLNNLMTKKARTLLTAFAGSIGIIGIASILSLSSGVQDYITGVQEETLASYPIQLEAKTVDFTSMLTSASQMQAENEHEMDKIYSSNMMGDMTQLMQTQVQTNNLADFKSYLEEHADEYLEYANEISYSYSITPQVYTTLDDGSVQQVNPSPVLGEIGMSEMMSSNAMVSAMMESYNVFTELRENETLRDAEYELVDGSWPESYDEVVLIIDQNNEISDYTLYTLGFKDLSEISEMLRTTQAGETFETESLTFTYDEMLGKEFSVVCAADYYADEDGDGVWTDHQDDEEYMKDLVQQSEKLKIVGIVRNTERSSGVSGGIGYTHALTEQLIEQADNAPVVLAQQADPETDILTGKPFDPEEEETAEVETAAAEETESAALTEEQRTALLPAAQAMGYDPAAMTEEDWMTVALSVQGENADGESGDTLSVLAEMGIDPDSLSEEQLAYLSTLSPEQLRSMMESYAAPTTNTYDGNLESFGVADLDSPSGIDLYPKTFADKDHLADLIEDYNDLCTADGREEDTLEYTDIVGLLMSSVTTIINAISYVLIAFVAISLVVSSIMIGIITYISVLERTKEIGILRAIGASKRDISNVFNAETLIIGFVSGAMGILITLLLLIPANMIIEHLTGIAGLAQLPVGAAVILVLISMLLTFIAGLIPSKMAARKDPVVALRSE